MENLELKSGNFFKGQKEFRKEYRENVNGWYNGFIHLGMIFSIGGIGIYYFSSHIEKIIWWEWLIIPITLIFANLFEWWIHKYVMHKPLNFPGAKAIYSRHTLQHHQFFTEHEMRFAGTHDWRVTLFPPYALAIFIAVLSAPAVIFLNLVISSNVGWLFIITTTSFYLLYEIMHFCCHVDDNIFVRNMPFINTIRRHHAAHHNKGIMMAQNMNLTFPFGDWLFGTSDLNRGLFGHFFNGYNKKHLKKNINANKD
tara:strand:+ start:1934 stop:2695 length:762 start_codon:yes stop_codon:yes gene_type:complete